MRAHARALLGRGVGVDSDLGAGLDRLCTTAANELRLPGVVLTLMARDGSQAAAGTSDEQSRRLEELQFSLGEGPGCEAFASGHPVLIADLEAAFVRWPGYVPEVLRAGTSAVYTFPLQLGAMRFGVLTFYAERAHTLGAPELTHCFIYADVATELLLESSAAGSIEPASQGLQKALRFRTEIYQAQGMVMVALEVSLVEALARMRAHAFALGLDLNLLAVGILDGSIRLPRDEE
jgi:hypothetical protein